MSAPSSVLLRFHQLRKAFGGQCVLDGLSGEVRQGQVILLRGENGSGKTTLLNILTGCLEPDSGSIKISDLGSLNQKSKIKNQKSGIRNQQFSFPRPWHADLNPFRRFTPERVARLGIGRTWQDVRLFGSLDLADNIAVAAPGASDSPWAALFRPRRATAHNRLHRRSAADTLSGLGLPARDTSSADKISLGQSKRVAIARALHAHARILFLDEPLAGLDADGIRDVLAHLRTLAAEHGLTLVIIEHVLNIPRLLDFVTTVWTLNNGALTISDPAVVREELAATPSATDIHALIRQALRRDVPVTTQSLANGAGLTTFWLAYSEPTSSENPVLEIENVGVERGLRRLFCNHTEGACGLTLQLHPGTLNLLEAPNGWGKSSLADVISGRSDICSGDIRYKREPLAANTWTRAQVGLLVSPSSTALFPSLSIEETLSLVKQPSSLTATVHEAKHKRVDALSGGERQQLALDSFCSMQGSLFVFDEPLAQLDGDHSRLYVERMLSKALHHTILILNPGTVPKNSR